MKRLLILMISVSSSVAYAEMQSNIEFLPTDFTNQVMIDPDTGNEVPVEYDPAIDAATYLVETDLMEEDQQVLARSCLFRDFEEKWLNLTLETVKFCIVSNFGPVKQKVTARYQFNLGRIQFCVRDRIENDFTCGSEINLSPSYQTFQVNYDSAVNSIFFLRAKKPTGTSLLQYYNYYAGP